MGKKEPERRENAASALQKQYAKSKTARGSKKLKKGIDKVDKKLVRDRLGY